MPNYANSKIYKILNGIDDEVYVGSTAQPLARRMSEHRKDARLKESALYKHMRFVGIENCYIELLEEYPCDNKDMLRAREGKWIRESATLNKHVAGRTNKQWVQDNLDYVKADQHQRYENNRQEIKEKVKEWVSLHKEHVQEKQKEYRATNLQRLKELGKTYRDNNVEKLKAKNIEYYELNKDKIKARVKTWTDENREHVKARAKEYRERNRDNIKAYAERNKEHLKNKGNELCACDCGFSYKRYNKSRHLKSAKHTNNVVEPTAE